LCLSDSETESQTPLLADDDDEDPPPAKRQKDLVDQTVYYEEHLPDVVLELEVQQELKEEEEKEANENVCHSPESPLPSLTFGSFNIASAYK